MTRIQSIGNVDSWNLRYWKEFFSRFSEPVNENEQGYEPDSSKQLDLAIEAELA